MLNKPLTIAIDAMGGDHGPYVTLAGAARSLKKLTNVKFLLFGEDLILASLLAQHRALAEVSTVIHTDKIVNSHDKPSLAVRGAEGTSMRLALEAVREGKADAMVSGGNTGSLMALAKSVLKPLPGIHRPAIASAFPSLTGETIMLDLGANVLVDAENLVQFAVLGAAFARAHRGITNPTVGLLNVGTEPNKGPDHVRMAGQILSQITFSGRYYGFVEGGDITRGTVDVVVSDGYAGNIALKAAEGVGYLSTRFFKDAIKGDPLAMLGAALAYFALKRFRSRIDPRLYNGGVFLGLGGLCVKSHGDSDALGFATAIGLAVELARHDYIARVGSEIQNLMTQDGFLRE